MMYPRLALNLQQFSYLGLFELQASATITLLNLFGPTKYHSHGSALPLFRARESEVLDEPIAHI